MSKITVLVGENIRTLRHQRGLSQENLALKAGINTSYIGQVERGVKSATIDTIEKIATALEVTIEELFKSNSDFMKIQYGIFEKLEYEMKRRAPWEQEVVYDFVKKLLWYRDNK